MLNLVEVILIILLEPWTDVMVKCFIERWVNSFEFFFDLVEVKLYQHQTGKVVH